MKNKFLGSSLDDFLEEEGIKEEVEIGAIKKLIAYQLQKKLEEEHITKTELAKRLDTSRSAVGRILDPYNNSITLSTLERAAATLGKKIKIELV
ncbi:MAG: helix-turn-helix domain-containing protein [Treponema sp.]|jgi:predicted transcriptional regulator|nr:helix-turn-helix domain-containing protein [Treponema sp.]